MKTLIATEYKILLCRNKYYVYSKFYNILKRYYDAFGRISILSRVCQTNEIDGNLLEITQLVETIYKIDLAESLLYFNYKRLCSIIENYDFVIGRFDSIVSCRAARVAKNHNKPFLAEVMADAWDGYWNHGFIGKLLAPYMYYATKKALWDADFAIYVTEHYLQSRYPCENKSTNASNVHLSSLDKTTLENRLDAIKIKDVNRVNLVTTAAVNVEAKGHKYVIEAIPALLKRGYDVQYYMIGGGDQSRLRKIACKNKVEGRVHFLGEMKLDDVFKTIDKCDIYIQPSLQEGLPRSVIEAMSRACPCVGAKTAGIPELLGCEYIFDRKSSASIVNVLDSIMDQGKLEEMACTNFEKAAGYTIDVLNKKRNSYFEYVKSKIENRITGTIK